MIKFFGNYFIFMNYFDKSIKEVLKNFETNTDTGLSEEQVLQSREKYGTNELVSKPPKSVFMMFLAQLNDWLIYILFGAVVLTIWHHEYIDAIIILMVILVNAVLGVVQEYRAGKAIEALKNMASPMALVKRNWQIIEIASKEIVVGDIVILDAGRIIPADIRLLESRELQIEESALTGESVPAKKDAEFIANEKAWVGDRKNMAFMSTVVTNGRATGIVVDVGSSTEVGHIANILDNEESVQTPLEIRLEHLGKTLGFVAIGICAIIFVVGLLQGRNISEIFLLSVSLAVASIPEGLAAIVAVVLSIGVTKMSKQNAIIKRLPAVETLGSVNIICSDKTGTLTQNKMTVVEIFTNNKHQKISAETEISENEKILAKWMFLCSDATYENGVSTGDPTEVALLVLADEFGLDRKILQKNSNRIAEFPFDSDRKLMSVEIEENNEKIIYTKGAIDNILKISTHILENGKIIEITENHKEQILSEMWKMSDKALRTLGLAFKNSNKILEPNEMEENLVFVGMVGMIDPPREEVKDSISKAKNAGITPIMITGDYSKTAFAIAKDLGIANDYSETITGAEIDELSEEEFSKKILNYKVFARVSPEHKVRIVRAFRSHGNIVSMTGDGVNDAPSLNAADIGVAMGITGTDVAKGAASMILLDDNFTTIVRAIESGRIIYNNIKKSIIFLLSCNLGEVVAMFFVLLAGWQTPLLAIQLLWINLVTDSFPAIALGMDKWDSSVMDEKPRSPKESFFSNGWASRIIFFGSLMGLVTIIAFFFGYFVQGGIMPWSANITEENTAYAQTFAFMTLVLTQLFFSLSIRSETATIFSREFFANKILILVVIASIILQFSIVNFDFTREIFHLHSIDFADLEIIVILSLIPTIFNEIRKIFVNFIRRIVRDEIAKK